MPTLPVSEAASANAKFKAFFEQSLLGFSRSYDRTRSARPRWKSLSILTAHELRLWQSGLLRPALLRLVLDYFSKVFV